MSGTGNAAPAGGGGHGLFDDVDESSGAAGARSSLFDDDDGDSADPLGLQGRKAGGSADESGARNVHGDRAGGASGGGGGAAPRAGAAAGRQDAASADTAAPTEGTRRSAASYGLFGEKAALTTDSLFGGSALGGGDSLFATSGGDSAEGHDIAEALFATDSTGAEDKRKPAPTARPAAHRRSVFAARGGAGEDGDDAAEGEGEHETEGLYAAAILGEAGKERGLFDDDGDDAKPVAASLGAGADSARELEVGGDDLIAAFEKGDEAAARSGPASGEAAEDALGLFDSSDTGMGGNASSLLAGLSEDDGGADLFGDGGQEGDDLFSMIDTPAAGSSSQGQGADVDIAAYIQSSLNVK